MASLGSAWRSFWHTMTSADRHASHNSPFRTGQHVPLSQNRHEPLTSVATNASDSRTDLNSTENGMPPLPRRDSAPATSPYSPGMRSEMHRTSSHDNKSGVSTGTGEIQMQAFSDGLPPPPPVSHSWKRIDRWAEDNYEELADNLCDGCTQNDINELEHELDCTLPMEVRESLQVHDGQDHGGRPTGIVFGSMLLDCEEIVQEWRNWRLVSEEFLTSTPIYQTTSAGPPPKAFDGVAPQASSSDTKSQPQVTTQPVAQSLSQSQSQPQQRNPHWREDLLKKQDSQPANAIQKAYAHPAWIPLARDWGGNNLAVDLSPGPAGKWGQVILMGRDYDCKYVVSRSWAAFLATLADDLNSSKWFVNEETGELKLREFRQQNVEPSYFDILRWRADQKYGRRALKKRPGQLTNGDRRASVPGSGSGGGMSVNVQTKPPSATRGSPYASPTQPSSPARKNSGSKAFPLASPLSNSSSAGGLSRVTEEGHGRGVEASEMLISPDSPAPLRSSGNGNNVVESGRSSPASVNASGKENGNGSGSAAGLGMQNIDLHDAKSS